MLAAVEIEAGQRDPRLDPRPGDVIAKQLKKRVAFREVTGRSEAPPGYVGVGEYHPVENPEGERVHWRPDRGWVFADGAHLGSWIAWCKGAVVLRVGE